MTPQQSVVSALLRRFPNAHTKTLARIAYRENKPLFTSLETARTAFRRARGNLGDKAARQAADKSNFKPAGKSGDPFAKLPESKTHFDDWASHQISGPARALVLSDIHFPYYDRTATLVALNYGKKIGADTLILNGDTFDFFSISDWLKDPRQRNFPEEVKLVREFLSCLRSGFPRARIVFKEGNHEERYYRYMFVKAVELLGIPEFEFASVLKLADIRAEHVGDKRPIRLGKLNLIHGHEYRFPISNPVNPARGYYLRAKAHCLGGHLHQTSQHSEKNLEQNIISTWSTGCLCDLHPDYRPLNNWNHGFAFVEVDRSGAFEVQNLRIIAGKVW